MVVRCPGWGGLLVFIGVAVLATACGADTDDTLDDGSEGGDHLLPLAGEVSLWPDNEVPSAFASADPGPIELGVKFRSAVRGTVTGIRFYKGQGNTGTHVGNLWTAAGALLATVTFAGETATGWQSARFATPVVIQPNTVYVAS